MLPRIMTLFFVINILSMFQGCSNSNTEQQLHKNDTQRLETSVACSDAEDLKAQFVVVVLIDRSGSFLDKHTNQAKLISTDVMELVQFLPAATIIFGRYISENSYKDSERFLRDAIPYAPDQYECLSTNPFDFSQKMKCQNEKVRYKAQLTCINKARERIKSRLKAITLDRSKNTDIWGAIAATEEIFSFYKNSQRILIVYSDLKDTMNSYLPKNLTGLQGARVILRTIRMANIDEKTDRLRNRLANRLIKLGAEIRRIPIEIHWSEAFS